MADYETTIAKYKLHENGDITCIWVINVNKLLAYYFCRLVDGDLPMLYSNDVLYNIPQNQMETYKKCLAVFNDDYEQKNGIFIYAHYNSVIYHMYKLYDNGLLPMDKCPKDLSDLFLLTPKKLVKLVTKLHKENEQIPILNETIRCLDKKISIILAIAEK